MDQAGRFPTATKGTLAGREGWLIPSEVMVIRRSG